MSQHIAGNIGQTVAHDYGPFVQIFELRVRKDLITAYGVAGPVHPEAEEKTYSVNMMIAGGWNSTRPHSLEECEKEVLRLDWLFKGEN